MAPLSRSNVSPPLALVAVTNAAMRALCRETLRGIGFAVANGAERGTAVVAEAREQHPDVIILSDQLSDAPASEVVKWLRSNPMSATSSIIILGRMGDVPRADLRLTVLPQPMSRAQLRDALTQILSSTKPTPTKPPVH
jgi:DNA-binding response OmpR family regulator